MDKYDLKMGRIVSDCRDDCSNDERFGRPRRTTADRHCY
jgi:hypothetical protein